MLPKPSKLTPTDNGWRRRLLSGAIGVVIVFCAGGARAQPRPTTPLRIDAQVALHSLVSLTDGHLRDVANVLTMLAATEEARSGSWERIRTPLASAARMNVAGAHWFAKPDGSYWTVELGRATTSLADRPYFARVLKGDPVIGDLVASKSTRRNSAIVAVPVRGRDGAVVGVLGSSVYLDSLSLQLRREMGVDDDRLLFFAIDSRGLGAVHSHPDMIFTEPLKLGDEGMRRAFEQILATSEGVVTYTFRDAPRTVVYQKSPLTGWRYAFGVVGGARTPVLGALGRRMMPPQREVVLGGLFSLTGNWSAFGKTRRAAMELAVEDVNRYLEGNSASFRFATLIEDTKLDPALALEKAKALRAKGVRLLIGAQSSAEVAQLKPYVDANGMLLVSGSSTAGSLAIAGDNVFRFTPSDSLEGVAVTALMWDDSIRAVVPVWREDPGNADLAKAIRASFWERGGRVLGGTSYARTTTSFAPTIAALRAELQRVTKQVAPAHVAVYLAGFDEVAGLLAAAQDDPLLSSVRWYGSDGAAHATSLIENGKAARFATAVGYPNPVFGLEEGARDVWAPLVERIRARTGTEADAFSLAVYDAVWVLARGYVASGGASLSIDQLKSAFMTAASTHYGATGWAVLNAAGDRKYGDFDFWAIRMQGGAPQWTRVAQYETRTGRLVRLGDKGGRMVSVR